MAPQQDNDEQRKLVAMHTRRVHTEKNQTLRGAVRMIGKLGKMRNMFKKDEKLNPADYTAVLMEIVSARRLGPHDHPVDPFCVVYLEGHEVHRTSVIHKDSDPIWSILTGSLLILEIPNKEREEGMVDSLVVEVHHRLRKIGTVTVPYADILSKKGEREEFHIIPDGEGDEKENERQLFQRRLTQGAALFFSKNHEAQKPAKGILALRFRHATKEDFAFFDAPEVTDQLNSMSALKVEHKEQRIADDINFHGEKNQIEKTIKQNLKKARKMVGNVEKVRVKPHPDPENMVATKWLSKPDLEAETLKPSKEWIEAGYGNLGKVYIEVLACDDLPNMDIGVNDCTDAFVGIVFEDTMVRTNVIYDELSPRWMPWCNRAFAFNVRHPSSLLLVGVFDYDDLTSHDSIGRVAITIERFESNTCYLLTYNLYRDHQQKQFAGRVKIRLRVEWENEGEAVKMSFVAPPRFLVNVENMKALQVLRYLCRGPVNMQAVSLESVSLYLEEMMSYGDEVFYLIDVIMGIMLWRGRGTVRCWKYEANFWWPVHSMFTFFMAALAVEAPSLIPPILCFSVSWVLLSINYYGSRHPSPWYRCKSVHDLNKVMVVGHSMHGPIHIKPHEGEKKAEELATLDRVKADRIKGLINEAADTASKISKVYSKTHMEDIAINTEDPSKGWKFINDNLGGIHSTLAGICTNIQGFRNMMNWRGYFAHQLAVYCTITGVVWFLLPVNRVIHWVMRLIVWTVLGPGMKLVDIYFVHHYYRTREELEADPIHYGWQLHKILHSESIHKVGEAARLAKEEAHKLKDMRTHVFGEFSQLIPAVDTSRFLSIPLPESSAQPYLGSDGDPKKGFVDIPEKAKVFYYAPGQRLEGDMIHTHVKSIGSDRDLASSKHETLKF